MLKHIQERTTPQPGKSAPPVRVGLRCAPAALRLLPDAPASRVKPRLSDRISAEPTASTRYVRKVL